VDLPTFGRPTMARVNDMGYDSIRLETSTTRFVV
jgi:hypothetical protein